MAQIDSVPLVLIVCVAQQRIKSRQSIMVPHVPPGEVAQINMVLPVSYSMHGTTVNIEKTEYTGSTCTTYYVWHSLIWFHLCLIVCVARQ